MTAPLVRRVINLDSNLDTSTLLAAIGGYLAEMAHSAIRTSPNRDDWRGSDIRIRRVYNTSYLRDQIEITWEER